MNYMTELAADLAEMEARDATPAGHVTPHADASAAAAVLLAEVMQAAGLVAVVASLFNALERRAAPPASLAAVRTFMPKQSAVFDAALIRLAAAPASATATRRVQDYSHAFELAVRLSDRDVLAGEEIASPTPIEMAAGAWRDVCVEARKAATALADIARSEAVAGRTSGLRTLRHLAAAAAGGTPSILETGALTLPDWAERRRAHRVAVDLPANLTWNGLTFEARILDMSETGARIATAGGPLPGEKVVLERPDGSPRLAIVRWIGEGTLGLEYATRAAVDGTGNA